jgi:hypothetical protein
VGHGTYDTVSHIAEFIRVCAYYIRQATKVSGKEMKTATDTGVGVELARVIVGNEIAMVFAYVGGLNKNCLGDMPHTLLQQIQPPI